MSTKKDQLTPPASSLGDKAHALAKAGIGSIPLVGAAATELFQMLLAPPLERRRQEWMEAVAEGLRRLEKEQRIDLGKLSENEAFIDTVMQASQVAMRNSHQEKRDALRNAVLNSALPHPIDESRQQMFLNLVDVLTVWHLRILKLLANPTRWFQAHNRKPPEYHIAGSLSQMLTTAYPELTQQRELYDQIAKELYDRGLLNTQGLHTVMSGGGVYAERATEFGRQFIAFVSEPNA
jgi:hypothetical protein